MPIEQTVMSCRKFLLALEGGLQYGQRHTDHKAKAGKRPEHFLCLDESFPVGRSIGDNAEHE